jgi:hypothetical protein
MKAPPELKQFFLTASRLPFNRSKMIYFSMERCVAIRTRYSINKMAVIIGFKKNFDELFDILDEIFVTSHTFLPNDFLVHICLPISGSWSLQLSLS